MVRLNRFSESLGDSVQRFHRTIQSVGATGGVYKGQGRNQDILLQELQTLWGTFFKAGKLVEFFIVARVRPRTSKGITDLLLPQTSLWYTQKVPLRSILIRR
eukprot:maker-scaffold_142-snap-gene-0.14-mRNA-1 protein AED:0.41 eAED:0.41 QI:0/0/0.5/1/0/0/2/542/101